MDSTIEIIQVQKAYASSLYLLSQQMKSRLAPIVTNETLIGTKSKAFNRIGTVDSQEITERHGDTPINEVEHSRRWVTTTPRDVNTPLDEEDGWSLIADPTNKYQQAQAAKLGRDTDDVILAAAVGTALCGEEQGTSVAFKDDSVSINGDGTSTSLGTLATAAGSGSVGYISLAKMKMMSLIFDDCEVDEAETRYWALDAKNCQEMLDLTEVGSVDYNTVKPLVTGFKTEMAFWGFQWRKISNNRMLKDAASSTAYRSIAFTSQGIILAKQKDIFTRISERPDKRYMKQVYSKMSVGAVRFDGDKVHECLNKVA